MALERLFPPDADAALPSAGSRKVPVVLLVDDDPDVRRVVGRALERDGFDAVVVADGEKGLRAFDQRRPDLVLLDVQMPRMDGFAVCEALRRHPLGGPIPIVMMTGLEDVAAIRRAYDAGATDFITKPLNWIILSHRLRYLLRANEALRALRASQQRLAAAQQLAAMGSWQLELASGEVHGSDALWHILGLAPRRRARAQLLAERIHPEDRRRLLAAVQRSIQNGRPARVDHRVTRADGRERLCHCQIAPVFDAEGELLRIEGVTQDITERRRTEEQIRFLTSHDSLTSLGNRQLFCERLELALRQARRHGTCTGVLFLDLDQFKRINETLGHSVGDSLLCEVAERIVASVRSADMLARGDAESAISRLGGDEFTLLLPRVREGQDLGRVARRIREILARPFLLDGHEVVISVSIGIAVFPGDGEDSESLLRNAETAMYHAKEQGRNNHQFYAASMNAVAVRRLILEGKLRNALERSQFELYYQPKIELESGCIQGFEALLRWNDPELGTILPGDFIPIAEETGLIFPLGEWVLEETCRQVCAWQAAGICDVPIAANLSPHQFRQPDLAVRIQEIVRRSGAPPRRIGLEVTEGSVLHDAEEVIRQLRSLREAGFELALDDFGTGYSSLSHLRQLPVHTMKLDRSFIEEIAARPDAAALAASIVAMGKAIGLTVVAEGVEQAAQRDLLRSWGCDQMQGYLFSRPLPHREAEQLWRQHRSHCTRGGSRM